MTLLESQRPQLGDQERPLQDPNSGRNNPQASWQYQVHDVGWNFVIPMHRSGLRVITPHHVQHTIGTVQVCTPTVWTRLLPGHLSANDGPDNRAL